jgi:hypothetical protein
MFLKLDFRFMVKIYYNGPKTTIESAYESSYLVDFECSEIRLKIKTFILKLTFFFHVQVHTTLI